MPRRNDKARPVVKGIGWRGRHRLNVPLIELATERGRELVDAAPVAPLQRKRSLLLDPVAVDPRSR